MAAKGGKDHVNHVFFGDRGQEMQNACRLGLCCFIIIAQHRSDLLGRCARGNSLILHSHASYGSAFVIPRFPRLSWLFHAFIPSQPPVTVVELFCYLLVSQISKFCIDTSFVSNRDPSFALTISRPITVQILLRC